MASKADHPPSSNNDSPAQPQRNVWQVLLAMLGTMLDYYDHTLYGLTAAVIANTFFPHEDLSVRMIQTFGVYAMASFAKPFGGIFFGSLGDRFGRSLALKWSMLGICIPTLIIAFLPGYETWGFFAPLALIICRISQGIFIAGEYDGARIYLYEHFGNRWPCFLNSLVSMSMIVGVYLASIACALALSVTDNTWMWRVPFALGGIVGLLIAPFRHYLPETKAYQSHVAKKTTYVSTLSVIKKNWPVILAIIFITGGTGATQHFTIIFLGNYISKILEIMKQPIAMQYTSSALLMYMLAAPVAGWVADHWGVVRTVTLSSLVYLGLMVLSMFYISQHQYPKWLMVCTTAAQAFFVFPWSVLIMDVLDISYRYRCLAMGHSLGSMLFSGLTPMFCMYIWKQSGWAPSPFLYIVCMVALTQVGLKFLQSYQKGRLKDQAKNLMPLEQAVEVE
jgi:MFS transporter, MHS family, proline/betaine transporter